MGRRSSIRVPNSRNAQLVSTPHIRPFRRGAGGIPPVVTIEITGAYAPGDTVGDVTTTVTGANSGEPPLDNGTIAIEVDGVVRSDAYVFTGGEELVALFSYTHPTGNSTVASPPVQVSFTPDLPYDGTFTPALLATDQYGFNYTGPTGTPPVPTPTTGNGQAVTGGSMVGNAVSARLDIQLTGPGGGLFRNEAGASLAAIVMQFDDEPTFNMSDNGGVRYRNNSVLTQVQYLQGKVGTSVRMRISAAPTQINIGPFETDGLTYYIRALPWEVGFNIDSDAEPDIWVTPEQLKKARIKPNQISDIEQKLIENGWEQE